jgi:hypothetical protein
VEVEVEGLLVLVGSIRPNPAERPSGQRESLESAEPYTYCNYLSERYCLLDNAIIGIHSYLARGGKYLRTLKEETAFR